jgi:hypothetical protein
MIKKIYREIYADVVGDYCGRKCRHFSIKGCSYFDYYLECTFADVPDEALPVIRCKQCQDMFGF